MERTEKSLDWKELRITTFYLKEASSKPVVPKLWIRTQFLVGFQTDKLIPDKENVLSTTETEAEQHMTFTHIQVTMPQRPGEGEYKVTKMVPSQ